MQSITTTNNGTKEATVRRREFIKLVEELIAAQISIKAFLVKERDRLA
jgi:hypothetical protein